MAEHELKIPLKTLHNTMRDKNGHAISHIHLETIVDCVNVCRGRPELINDIIKECKESVYGFPKLDKLIAQITGADDG